MLSTVLQRLPRPAADLSGPVIGACLHLLHVVRFPHFFFVRLGSVLPISPFVHMFLLEYRIFVVFRCFDAESALRGSVMTLLHVMRVGMVLRFERHARRLLFFYAPQYLS